jgi:hypothetical protein
LRVNLSKGEASCDEFSVPSVTPFLIISARAQHARRGARQHARGR